MRKRGNLSSAAILAAMIGLPLLGAWISGRDLSEFFLFPPPLRIPTDYPRFSWIAAGLVVAALAAIVTPWVFRLRHDVDAINRVEEQIRTGWLQTGFGETKKAQDGRFFGLRWSGRWRGGCWLGRGFPGSRRCSGTRFFRCGSDSSSASMR